MCANLVTRSAVANAMASHPYRAAVAAVEKSEQEKGHG
jgi:hypothetical protein